MRRQLAGQEEEALLTEGEGLLALDPGVEAVEVGDIGGGYGAFYGLGRGAKAWRLAHKRDWCGSFIGHVAATARGAAQIRIASILPGMYRLLSGNDRLEQMTERGAGAQHGVQHCFQSQQ
jgi:hypothetical protein